MKQVAAVMVSLALVFGPAATVAAAKPVEKLQPPTSVAGEQFILEEGVACDFPVLIEILKGKEGGMIFEERAIFTAPGLTARVTNLDTGESVRLVIAGAFHDTFNEDGTVTTHATGRNLLFTFPEFIEAGADPFLLLTVGSVRFTINFEDSSFAIHDAHKVVNVCALLS